jgi:hypothetical protein
MFYKCGLVQWTSCAIWCLVGIPLTTPASGYGEQLLESPFMYLYCICLVTLDPEHQSVTGKLEHRRANSRASAMATPELEKTCILHMCGPQTFSPILPILPIDCLECGPSFIRSRSPVRVSRVECPAAICPRLEGLERKKPALLGGKPRLSLQVLGRGIGQARIGQ